MRISNRIWFPALLAGLALLLGGCLTATRSAFTPWMDQADFNGLLGEYETKVDGKNFWSRGHWVDAVEGRWRDGRPQYRIKVGETPRDQKFSWYWWFNQSAEDFNGHIHRLSDDGYTLVHSSSFVWPDGTTRHNGVWHRTGR